MEDAPKNATLKARGRVGVAVNAFVDRVLRAALNNIPLERRTARDGARYLTEIVDTMYMVYHED